METAIEIIADAMNSQQTGIAIGEILVPEQCMTVYINGRAFHVTIEPFENQEENV